jgi:rubrerythrin
MSTEQKLLDLYAGLSRAATRCHLYALRADKDGRPSLAKLFRALA